MLRVSFVLKNNNNINMQIEIFNFFIILKMVKIKLDIYSIVKYKLKFYINY